MWFSWKTVNILLIFFCNYVCTLKDVVINIEPPIVERGQTASIRCNYNLEGTALYSVKWYRGHLEFYRYTPNEIPATKVFPLRGLEVNLQLSDEHQVVLQNVNIYLSGNFSCEVTTDSPDFSTTTVSKNMLVVVLPKYPPTLTTQRTDYEVNDTVRADCTSAPSTPAAVLVLSINNMVIPSKLEHQTPASRDLSVSHASVEFQLSPSHFRDGVVYLHCLAQVTNLYQHDTSVRLANLNDSVPTRVTSHEASGVKLAVAVLFLN